MFLLHYCQINEKFKASFYKLLLREIVFISEGSLTEVKVVLPPANTCIEEQRKRFLIKKEHKKNLIIFSVYMHLAQKWVFLSHKYKKIAADTFSTVSYQNQLLFLHKSMICMSNVPVHKSYEKYALTKSG